MPYGTRNLVVRNGQLTFFNYRIAKQECLSIVKPILGLKGPVSALELLVLMAMLAPYSATIATALKLYTDPTYDSGMGQVTLTKAKIASGGGRKTGLKLLLRQYKLRKMFKNA